jgi:hypothetical protein
MIPSYSLGRGLYITYDDNRRFILYRRNGRHLVQLSLDQVRILLLIGPQLLRRMCAFR